MKHDLLKLSDELSITYAAFEGLQIILGGSSTDSEIVNPILTVINEKLKRCIDDLERVRNGTLGKEGKTKLEIVTNQP